MKPRLDEPSNFQTEEKTISGTEDFTSTRTDGQRWSAFKPLEIALDHADINRRSSARNRIKLLICQRFDLDRMFVL